MAWFIWQDKPELVEVTVGAATEASVRPLRIVQLSDLHMSGMRDVWRLKYALRLTQGANPDAIVFTGDYVRSDASQVSLLLDALQDVHAPLGVYAVLGNHDLWSDRRVITDGLHQAGIVVLNNQGRVLGQGNSAVYLAGLDDGWSGAPDLEAALAANDQHLPVVLLWHEPDLGEIPVREGRVWLHLAGHSHGGQIRLPGRRARVLPGFAYRYWSGLHSVGPGWIYVNRGLGTTSIPIRLGSRPEVTLLSLYPPARHPEP
ncbi:MAG: metallophosphoesterase [Anaerolineae bacterium]|nr:metallophosphoesterase [Chloroflexota bacterium]